jgi:hypothetical protein
MTSLVCCMVNGWVTGHRSCIEAVAMAHSRAKRQAASRSDQEESYFTSLPTATEQARRPCMHWSLGLYPPLALLS